MSKKQSKSNKTKCDRVVKVVKKRIPIVKWLPEYNSNKLFSDMIAGVTVGLTVMPQGLAYASLAGLPTQVSVTLMGFPKDFLVDLYKIFVFKFVFFSMGCILLLWDASFMLFLEVVRI